MILLYIDSKRFPRRFIEKLKIAFKNNFDLLVEQKRLNQIEETLIAVYNLPKTFNLYKTCIYVILESIILEGNDSYSIITNPNLRINGIKLDSIIKAMTFGSLVDIKAYPIFSVITNNISLELDYLFDVYNETGVII